MVRAKPNTINSLLYIHFGSPHVNETADEVFLFFLIGFCTEKKFFFTHFWMLHSHCFRLRVKGVKKSRVKAKPKKLNLLNAINRSRLMVNIEDITVQ